MGCPFGKSFLILKSCIAIKSIVIKLCNSIIPAQKLDGCDIRGYFAWSLMDNMEWRHGYSLKFGMHHVDFSDPNRPRTPKSSAAYYSKLIRDNGFNKELNG